MSAHSLREKLASSAPLLGLGYSYPAPGIIEAMAPGYDVLWIDCQHGQLVYADALAALRTVTAMSPAGLHSMIRVVGHDPALLALFADLAPDSLMVPMVNTPAQAQSLVAALNFPPRGHRSYGGRRAIDLHGRAFMESHTPLLVAQIETAESFAHVAAIIATEGIDMLLFGAEDFKLSLGFPIDTAAHEIPQVRDAMAATARAAQKCGKFAGCLAYSPEVAALATAMGYHLLIAGSDSSFLHAAAADCLRAFRPPK